VCTRVGTTVRVDLIDEGVSQVRTRMLIRIGLAAAVSALALAGCGGDDPGVQTPDLAPRGTQMTTAQPTRQDLSNKVSLTGKVEMNPVFGLVAPVDGQVRFYDIAPQTSTPTRPTAAANVWADNKANRVEIPAGATFAGRLVTDRSMVTTGMPIVSARHAGYGIVAEVDATAAYKITDGLASVRVQIQSGPGPFACAVLGTIAALPAGTIPPREPDPVPEGQQPPANPPAADPGTPASAATPMRLVCIAPADVKLINGAAATVEVITATVTNALVLPVEAVAGSQGKGQVDVMQPDGTKKTVEVELGITDGKVIEIKSGLTGDETVAVPGPSIPPGAPAEGEGGPGMVRK
jgi:hypothetical protein